jgi:hypothetical protein
VLESAGDGLSVQLTATADSAVSFIL